MSYRTAMSRGIAALAAVIATLALAAPAHAVNGGPDGSSCDPGAKPTERTSWYTDPPSERVTFKAADSYTRSACIQTTGRWAVTYRETYQYRVVVSTKGCDLYEREAVGFGASFTRWSWLEDQPPKAYCS